MSIWEVNLPVTPPIYYDAQVVATMRIALRRALYGYRSNWRVLHIDGFERPMTSLPRATGRPIKIFEYEEAARA